LIGIVVEFSAGMQNGHDDLGGGASLFFVNVDGNSATIVRYRHGLIAVDDDPDRLAVSGQSFIDRVIHDLEHHMVKPGAVVGVADIHTRTLADGIKPLEDLNGGAVIIFSEFGHAHFYFTLALLAHVPRGTQRRHR